MRNKETSVSAKPIVSKDSSGNIAGVGVNANFSNSNGSIDVGGFKSKQTTSFWASAEKPIGNSSSIGVSAAASNQGYREASISFKKNF